MKRIIETVNSDGLEKLLGEQVQLWCLNYIYSGKLVGVNDKDCVLEDAAVVYETGKLGESGWKTFEPIGEKEWFVKLETIESYGLKTK